MRGSKLTPWQQRATRLAARFALSDLHPKPFQWVEGCPKARWAVAFSGGADSLALLLLLWAHFPGRRATLVALHFNHRLRGAASFADERFCRRVCESLGIRFRCGRWAEAKRGTSEAAARAARHAFFESELSDLRASSLWLGHQQDDIAETMLMRLARGSGTAGLAAPRPVNRMPGCRVHLRPLLRLKKAVLVDALRAENIPWREDGTNSADVYLRNRMRATALPAWIEASHGRDALAGAALSRDLLEEDDNALEAWLDSLAPIAKNGSLNLRRLSQKPRGLVRRALHRWLMISKEPVSLSRQSFNTLLEAVMSGRSTRHSVGTHRFVKVSRTVATFVEASENSV